jgi:hypothetical protein
MTPRLSLPAASPGGLLFFRALGLPIINREWKSTLPRSATRGATAQRA